MSYIPILNEIYTTRKYKIIDNNYSFKYLLHCLTDVYNNKIFTLANFNDKITVNIIKECIAFLTENCSNHCIIIHNDNITPIVKKIINNSQIQIDLFSEEELGYNVTKHVLVPKHELCTDCEYKSLENYISKIPYISVFDPVIKFHGFKKGQVVKITRKNNVIIYRLII